MNLVQYLDILNQKQKEAALFIEGPLLIIAGAGAGKTKTITHRIIHLVHQGINPSSILAITFTNKAAKEMRDRVLDLLEKRNYEVEISKTNKKNYFQEIPFISTFHSLGVYIIRQNAQLINLNKNFTILDENDTLSIIKDIMKNQDLDLKLYEPRKIKSVISKAKGNFITLEKYQEQTTNYFQELVASIWREYENRLKKEGSLDFDDLLLKTVLILKKFPEVRNKYQLQWQYLHIDEYQDTNEVQYEMTRLLVNLKQNICVVGDTDQNIYSWRGANIKNILHFEKDFPKTKTIILEQNYRSTKNILEAANFIIQKNKYRFPKNLFTQKKTGEKINIYETYDENSEAKLISLKIKELIKKIKPEKIAILYRANFQSRVLEEALLNQQIPYQVLGVKFFERKEIKDLLAYVKAAQNKESWSDLKRIINFPARGIGKTTLLKIFTNQTNNLPLKMQEKIKNFYFLLNEIEKQIKTEKPSKVLKFIIEKTNLEEKLKNGSTDEQESLENMKELVSLAIKYDQLPQAEAMEKLLEEATLASDQDSLLHKNQGVKLMTVHASKGLEFKNVFVAGLEQNLFPHSQDRNKSVEDQEEERRLFYVALTRAEEEITLSYACLRTIFGSKQVNSPSEFIYDIPEHLTNFEQIELKDNPARNASYNNADGEKIVYL
jgi:DNA helicase-2/ATP-dependent DNA helicase PcrA